jgi:hypothetical protein
LFVALALILNLSGMTYSTPPNQVCSDCYDQIQVNSSVWEIKVEHAGDQPILFAKSVTSRTRWLNLDKISGLVPTNPEVFVEILVPTTKQYSTMQHEQFGYLRPLKDGDTLIARQNKNNPRGSRFVVHGITNWQNVKWGFGIDSLTMDGINIDPIWLGLELNAARTKIAEELGVAEDDVIMEPAYNPELTEENIRDSPNVPFTSDSLKIVRIRQADGHYITMIASYERLGLEAPIAEEVIGE